MAQESLFGRLLKDWRTNILKCTLVELEAKLDRQYNHSTLAYYERGERKPSGEFFAILSIKLDIPQEVAEDWIESLALDFQTELLRDYIRRYKALGGHVEI